MISVICSWFMGRLPNEVRYIFRTTQIFLKPFVIQFANVNCYTRFKFSVFHHNKFGPLTVTINNLSLPTVPILSDKDDSRSLVKKKSHDSALFIEHEEMGLTLNIFIIDQHQVKVHSYSVFCITRRLLSLLLYHMLYTEFNLKSHYDFGRQ